MSQRSSRTREASGSPSGPITRACRCVRLDADRENAGESPPDQGVVSYSLRGPGEAAPPGPEERSRGFDKDAAVERREARASESHGRCRASTARRRCALARCSTVAPRGAPLPLRQVAQGATDCARCALRVRPLPRAMRKKTRRGPDASFFRAGGALAMWHLCMETPSSRAFASFSPCGRRWLVGSDSEHEPDEGPARDLQQSTPLPQGERGFTHALLFFARPVYGRAPFSAGPPHGT